MLQSLHTFDVLGAFAVLTEIICIAMLTIVVPVRTYNKYYKKRHMEGARLTFLLIGGGVEAFFLALVLAGIHVLGWWPTFNRLVNGSRDFSIPLAFILIIGLMSVGMLLLTIALDVMPNDLRDRAGEDAQNTPR
jgi:hypothetical protein